MDGLLSKSTDAIRDAEWELNPDSEFTEEDKPEFIKHMKEVIDNGILTGDWTDSYQKTHPERALKVNLGDLSLTEIKDVKTQKDEALVNVKMKMMPVRAMTSSSCACAKTKKAGSSRKS